MLGATMRKTDEPGLIEESQDHALQVVSQFLRSEGTANLRRINFPPVVEDTWG